jgi:hypothetical protein
VAVRHDARTIARTAATRAAAIALCVAALLALSLPAAPARAQQSIPAIVSAPAAAPAPQAWLDALAAVQRQPRAYHGSVGRRSLHVGLGLPGPDGRFDGTAVLLDVANHVVASGPVHGRADGPSCRLCFTLGDTTAHLSGACRPATLSGTLDEVRHQPFDLIRFLYAKGNEHVVGEVWLTAGA